MAKSKKIAVFQKSRVYNGGIKIPFSEIFNEPKFKAYENFDLSKKRTYYNFHEFFIQENNKLMAFDKENEIITNYLMLKYSTDKEFYKSPEEFIDDLFAQILKPWFLQNVGEYVEQRFKAECQDIDKSIHNQEGKLNQALVFNNFHAIIFYKMAVLMRFMAPLATHFMRVYSDMISNISVNELKKAGQEVKFANGLKMFDRTTFLIEIAVRLLNVLTAPYPEVNLYGKLNNYILNNIKTTEYTDSEMWNKLSMRSVTKYTVSDVIMNKILIDIIPKSSFKKHIIKFMVVTIESQLDWTIIGDFKINYNMISAPTEESEFSDADRFEINSAKTNIQKKIFNDNFADDTIGIIFAREGYLLDSVKYNWYYERNLENIPNLQIYLIYNFFAKHFGGYNNLDGLDYNQWIKLLVFLIDYMEYRDYKVLQYLITGRVREINSKRVLNKTVEKKIKDSIRYKRIMDKYSDTGSTLAESKTLEQHMMYMLNSEIEYNHFGYKDNGKLIELDLTEAVDEFLRFIEEL